MKSKSYKSDHALEILKKLNEDRIRMKNYCDVTITAQSNDFAGHKCVLGVFSTFFSKMFSIEMQEKYKRKGVVQGVTEETLEAVLSFIYTCDVTITSENVYNLIEAANYMEIPHLKEFCVEFLLEEIDTTNCLHVRTFAKLYNLDKLVEKANFVIANHLESLINETEWKELKFEDIKEILEMEDKQVTSEEIVFNGMIEWIKHDVDTRRQHLNELFSLLKLEKLSTDFLQNVVSQEELIMNINECLQMCFKSTLSRLPVQQNNQVVAEQQKAENHFLAFAGNEVWNYDVTNKSTNNLPNTKFDHWWGSVVRHKRRVYVISGDGTNEVESFDLENQASGWTQLASINMTRYGGASVVFDGRIYNYGGLKAPLSGECYNIDENRWNRIDDMNEGRYGFALVSTNREIYAIGGFDDDDDELKTVEYHDPRQGGWKMIPSMKVARQGLAGVVLNDQLYAIGGWNNGNLKSVERFDPLNQTWCNVAEMNHARSCFGACVSNGKIYVTGGGSDAVEVYDPERNIWEIEANIPEFEKVQLVVAV